MTQFVSCDFSHVESHARSACDHLIWEEVLGKIDSLPLKQRVALCSVRGIGQTCVPVKDLAASWGVSSQRVYQLAREAINELRQGYRSDDE